MPTLFTALRSHVPAVKARKNTANLQPYGLENDGQPEGSSRKEKRTYLQAVVKATLSTINKSHATREIVVIGARLAGLSAAYELSSVGYKVTVLEGQRGLEDV